MCNAADLIGLFFQANGVEVRPCGEIVDDRTHESVGRHGFDELSQCRLLLDGAIGCGAGCDTEGVHWSPPFMLRFNSSYKEGCIIIQFGV